MTMTRSCGGTVGAQNWLGCNQLCQIAFECLCWLGMLSWSCRVWIRRLFDVFNSMWGISINIETTNSWTIRGNQRLVFIDLRVSLTCRVDSLVLRWTTKPPSKWFDAFVICFSHDIFYTLARLSTSIASLLTALSLSRQLFTLKRLSLCWVIVFGKHAYTWWTSRLVWLPYALVLVLLSQGIWFLS